MSTALRISLFIGILIYFCVIVILLKTKRVNLNYSLIWVLTTIVLFIMTIFPQIPERVTRFLGIETVVNGIFLIYLFFILMLLISLTSIVSKQHNQIKSLVQTLAILRKDVDELSKNRCIDDDTTKE